VFGQSVTFTATVSPVAPGAGTPTGTVTFLDGGSPIGTGTLSGGVATVSTLGLGAGNHNITATYSGDGSFNGSAGTLTQQVNPAATATAVASSQNPSTFGQAVSFTATVTNTSGTGVTPTGSVQFAIDSVNFGTPVSLNVAGTATSGSISTLTVGGSPHVITATYIPADANFSASTGTLNQNVTAATTATSVSSSQNPSVFGQAVSFTATVTNTSGTGVTPTGSVQFVIDGVNFGTPVSLNAAGTATSGAISTLTVSGSPHVVTAAYIPANANFSASTGTLNQNVTAAATATSVSSSQNPSVFGQAVSFAATVTNTSGTGVTPTGSVQFVIDGVNFGPAVGLSAAGTATSAATSTLTVSGSPHLVTATYIPANANFSPSSGGISQTVNKANTTTTITSVSPEPSILAAPYTVKWTVAPAFSGTPTGTVTVTAVDGNTCSAAVSAGQCVISTSSYLGSKTLTASYSGDGSFNSSTGTASHTVIFAPTGTCDGDAGHQILQPINADGTSTFKQGSTVPAKFRVCDANGNSIGAPGTVTAFNLVSIISGTTTQTVDETVVSTTPDTSFRWDPTAQQWIFNISTKPLATHATYVYQINLADGSKIMFQYGLPK
jgi:hypothetical protein